MHRHKHTGIHNDSKQSGTRKNTTNMQVDTDTNKRVGAQTSEQIAQALMNKYVDTKMHQRNQEYGQTEMIEERVTHIQTNTDKQKHE